MNSAEEIKRLEKERIKKLKEYQLTDEDIESSKKYINYNEVDDNQKEELGLEILNSIIANKIPFDIEKIILKGANLNYLNNDKKLFPLLICARKNQIETAKLLIGYGADVNMINEYGTTALMAAARHGNKEIVEMLLLRGADVNMACKDGDTALFSAKMHDKQECFNLLVNAGAYLNHRNLKGETIFDIKGNIDLSNIKLLDKNVDFNKVTMEDAFNLINEAEEELKKLTLKL